MRRKLLPLLVVAILLAVFAAEPISASTAVYFGFGRARGRVVHRGYRPYFYRGFGPPATVVQWGHRPYRRYPYYNRRSWQADARWRALLFRQAEERRACRFRPYAFGCADLGWRQYEERLRVERLLRYEYGW